MPPKKNYSRDELEERAVGGNPRAVFTTRAAAMLGLILTTLLIKGGLELCAMDSCGNCVGRLSPHTPEQYGLAGPPCPVPGLYAGTFYPRRFGRWVDETAAYLELENAATLLGLAPPPLRADLARTPAAVFAYLRLPLVRGEVRGAAAAARAVAPPLPAAAGVAAGFGVAGGVAGSAVRVEKPLA
jgi:hypothetical protein